MSGRHRFGAVIGALVGVVFVAAACQTPGTQSSSRAAGASASPSGTTIVLSLKEYSISPKTVTLKAGVRVTIIARNDGTISHALVVAGNGLHLTTADQAFPPGASETITATFTSGTYTFFCPVDGHAALGMMGTITVVP